MNGPPLENPFAPAFRVSGIFLFFILAASLSIFVPPLTVFVPILGAVLLWVLFRHPIWALGALLAFMPVDYMAIELGKFFGFPNMALVSACSKELPLLLLTLILWRRNGFKPTTADWFLLALLSLAIIRTVFGGTLIGLVTDCQFMIPYTAGRVTFLTAAQEHLWAKRAVWIVGVLSVLGMAEVFIFGEGPRTILYLATDAFTVDGGLGGSFHGAEFAGLREASTMIGPPSFAALCMIALILWWVYSKKTLPGAMVAAGLICSVTRAAWLGTALAIPVLAVAMKEQRRLAIYAVLCVAMFAAAIPLLGLTDYLLLAKTGQDLSEQSHLDSIVTGLRYIGDHPLGGGNAKIGPRPAQEDSAALIVETSYLAFGAEYGIGAAVCFLGFLLSAMHFAWRQQSQLGYAAFGILVGLGLAMTVLILHDDRRLACWEWFPIGLAVQSSARRIASAIS
jgi:hypothetical protein